MTIVLVLGLAACLPAAAQWLNYSDPGIPRTRNGKADLTAAVPRVNGKPDFSGVWQTERTPYQQYAAAFGAELIGVEIEISDITKHALSVFWGLKPEQQPLRHSVARWLGDTLIVASSGFTDRARLDLLGHPRSESTRITERYHRRDFGHMDLEVLIEDPVYYTRPFGFQTQLHLLPDTDMLEYVCAENEKSRQHMR